MSNLIIYSLCKKCTFLHVMFLIVKVVILLFFYYYKHDVIIKKIESSTYLIKTSYESGAETMLYIYW